MAAAAYFEKEQHSSDEEIIDYLSLMPINRIVPPDFKFAEEPLFKPLLEKKRAGVVFTRDDYWKEATIRLHVESLESPGSFRFTLLRHREDLMEMTEKMRKIYNLSGPCEYQVPGEFVTPKLPVVAVVCNQPLRGYVLQNIDKNTCKVQPVDGGAPLNLPTTKLRFLHKSLAEYPRYGYHGKVAGVMPSHGTSWSREASNAFADICSINTKMKYIVGVISCLLTDGTVVMQLWSKSTRGEEMWASDELIRRRLAREDRTPPEHIPGRASPDKDDQAAVLAELMAKSGIGPNMESQDAANKTASVEKKVTATVQGSCSAPAPVQ